MKNVALALTLGTALAAPLAASAAQTPRFANVDSGFATVLAGFVPAVSTKSATAVQTEPAAEPFARPRPDDPYRSSLIEHFLIPADGGIRGWR